MDGLLCPTSLTFDVPAIPKAMLEKALWYVEHQDTHMVTFDFTETPGEPAFYVLSQTGGGDALDHHEAPPRDVCCSHGRRA